MSWTEERIAKLEELWNEGLTASAIAKELGNVTRNAVIGKVHRLGLKSRTKPVRKTAQEQHVVEEAAKVKKEQVSEQASEESQVKNVNEQSQVHASVGNAALKIDVEIQEETQSGDGGNIARNIIPVHQRATILQLNERRCKWPIGDPLHDDFHYCGQAKEAGKSYCEAHCKIAHQTNDRN